MTAVAARNHRACMHAKAVRCSQSLRGGLRSRALIRDVADGRLELHEPLSGAIPDRMETHLHPDEVASLPS